MPPKKSTKYLLIGGGLASGQAAKQLREKDPQSPITLVGEEKDLAGKNAQLQDPTFALKGLL